MYTKIIEEYYEDILISKNSEQYELEVIPNLHFMEETGELWPLTRSAFRDLFGAEYSNELLLSKKLHNLFLNNKFKDLPRAEDPHSFYKKELPKLYIKYISEKIGDSEEIGYGVFAGEDIEPGRFLGNYSGRIIARTGRDFFCYARGYSFGYIRRKLTNKFIMKNSELYKGEIFINAEKHGNHTRLINDGSGVNTALMVGTYNNARYVHFYLVSSRLIKKGEEIIDNYGQDYWDVFFEVQDGLREPGHE